MSPVKSDNLIQYFTERALKVNPGFKANRQSMHFTFKDMLMDYTTDEVKELIDFYFEHWQHPSYDFKGFRYNYDEIAQAMEARNQEVEKINKLKHEAHERALKWKERFARTQDDSGDA